MHDKLFKLELDNWMELLMQWIFWILAVFIIPLPIVLTTFIGFWFGGGWGAGMLGSALLLAV